jgi:hypothetical protein
MVPTAVLSLTVVVPLVGLIKCGIVNPGVGSTGEGIFEIESL